MPSITVRVPAIVTADGKWAINGSRDLSKDDPDWQWLDEMCDHENATVCPQRMWVTIELPVPEIKEVTAGAVELSE